MSISNRGGFSMTELMVVALISTAAFAGIYSTFVVGNRTWDHYNNSVAVKKEVRRALTGMVNELREAENIRINQNSQGTAIHFHRPSTGDVSYVWRKEGEGASNIIKQSPRGQRIMARHISALTFRKSQNSLFVNIAASKDANNTNLIQVGLREKIALRSKTALYSK